MRSLRVGFTASKKIGDAVVRNRAKRRLRAAAACGASPFGSAQAPTMYLVARARHGRPALRRLVADLAEALRAAHVKLGRAGETR